MSSWVQGAERFRRSNILGWCPCVVGGSNSHVQPVAAWTKGWRAKPPTTFVSRKRTTQHNMLLGPAKQEWRMSHWQNTQCRTDQLHLVNRERYLAMAQMLWGMWKHWQVIWLQPKEWHLRDTFWRSRPSAAELKSMCSFGHHSSSHSPLAAPPASAWRFWIFMLTSTIRKAPIQIHCPSLLACGVWTFLMVTFPNSAS